MIPSKFGDFFFPTKSVDGTKVRCLHVEAVPVFAARRPPSQFTAPSSSSAGGENKVKKPMDWNKDREITYLPHS